ncbi:RHS repeat domain-containing protein [Dyella acidisoli]|nr:RHS repeat-associated core domain-containing protein [Dyella acidisoli]
MAPMMKNLLMILAFCIAAVSAHAGTVTYVYSDPQGTPLAEADAKGNITATFDYTPYGTTALGAPPNGPGYTGHVNDPETNLVYMQARYFDSATGRFLSVDPKTVRAADIRTFSRYTYADSNPITKMDPNGESTCANKDCSMSTIDVHPAGPNGPTITFVNDNPRGASPNQPVTTATAKMVESAVIRSGVSSVNINSSTGGTHSATSRHPGGMAVDIDMVNGQNVRTQGSSNAVQNLQNAFEQEPNSRENFGPSKVEVTPKQGDAPRPVTNSSLVEQHENHIHEGGQH